MNLNKVHLENVDDMTAVSTWCDATYRDWFGQYFSAAKEHFSRLKSDDKPITDAELTWILIDLPITLFNVSEYLSKFRVNREVIKLKNKQKEHDLRVLSAEATLTKKAEDADLQMIENKLLALAYDTTVQRVESEISFCRELIMGAKKVWDARRRTDGVNPVRELDEQGLPAYKPAYIK